MNKFYCFALVMFLCLRLNAQDLDYARKIMEDICAPSFHGRGYVQSGDKMAADYLAAQCTDIGLKSFNQDYFQTLKVPINTFPHKMYFTIEGEEKKAGVDYLVTPSSKGQKGNYKLLWINKEYFEKSIHGIINAATDYRKMIIVVDSAGIKPQNKEFVEAILSLNVFNAAGIIELVDKLPPWGVSQRQNDYLHIKLLRSEIASSVSNVKVDIQAKFIRKYKTQNVVGYIPGKVDSFIVFSAHYDHLGRMGAEAYFPGAHDNASGTATVLDLARYYMKGDNKYSLVFILFTSEELGLLGSKYFTENPLFSLSKIKFLLNLDLLGSGEEGIQVVNGAVFQTHFDRLSQINKENRYLKQIKKRGAAANSDHYFFYQMGVPCFFIYTLGAYKEYHNIHDKSDAVPLPKYNELFRLFVDFADGLN